jgi:hypothetical protein
MHPLLDSVPEGNALMLRAEGGACYEYRAGNCRMVLAVGQKIDNDPGEPSARVGVVLREETVALLWACHLARGELEARPTSPLYHLPCHWVGRADSPEDGAEEGPTKRGGGQIAVLRLLDDVLLLKPESAVGICVGENQDDAAQFVAFVGLDEHDGQRRAILFQDWWLGRLWQTLLMGPGAYFAEAGSPLHEAFAKTDAAEEGEENE